MKFLSSKKPAYRLLKSSNIMLTAVSSALKRTVRNEEERSDHGRGDIKKRA